MREAFLRRSSLSSGREQGTKQGKEREWTPLCSNLFGRRQRVGAAEIESRRFGRTRFAGRTGETPGGKSDRPPCPMVLASCERVFRLGFARASSKSAARTNVGADHAIEEPLKGPLVGRGGLLGGSVGLSHAGKCQGLRSPPLEELKRRLTIVGEGRRREKEEEMRRRSSLEMTKPGPSSSSPCGTMAACAA